jgi:hypothetical protein
MKRPFRIAILSFAALGVLVLAAPQARAALIVVAPTSSTNGSITITNDITFTISTAGNAQVFALDEWVTSDGAQNGSAVSPDLSVSVNGGAPGGHPNTFFDNLAMTVGAITPNDGYFYLSNAFAVSAGNTVTLKAATYTLAATPGFNPQANQTFTGNMFITDDVGNQLSNVVAAGAVPEPSTWTMLLLGGMIAGLWRVGRATSKA